MKKKVMGVLVAPVVIPLLVLLTSASRCGTVESFTSACLTRAGVGALLYALYGIPICWMALLLLGLPALWLASKVLRLNSISTTLIGGALGMLLMTAIALPTFSKVPQIMTYYVIYGFIFGALVALVYWKIASKSYTKQI